MANAKSIFICDHCNQEFGYMSCLRLHVQHIHGAAGTLSCDVCPKKFTWKSSLLSHVVTHQQPRSRALKCQLCPSAFLTKKGLQHHHSLIHENIHRITPKFACEVCSKKFDTKCNLVTHIKFCPKYYCIDVFKCQLCGRDFHSEKTLLTHRALMHKGRKFQCDTCGKLFGLKYSLSTHIASVHQHQHPWQCNLCGAKFKLSGNFKKHVELEQRPYRKQMQCDDCDAKFTWKEGLQNHQFACKARAKLRLFACNECTARFSVKSNLNAHMKSVHKIKLITCDVCGKSFIQRYQLAIHYYLTHMELCHFKCTVCDQGFSTRYLLTKHGITLHSNPETHITTEQHHQCDACGAMFGGKRNFLGHTTRVHLRQLIYDCVHCEGRFRTIDILNRHMRAVHEKNMLICDHCGKSFMVKNNLGIHCHALMVH